MMGPWMSRIEEWGSGIIVLREEAPVLCLGFRGLHAGFGSIELPLPMRVAVMSHATVLSCWR